MTAYYNEIDPFAANWLRNLIAANLIAPGVVDERPIQDVQPSDLSGFTQHHFFAGIGGWSLALRRASVPDNFPVWTGSCPCQPFSRAGKRAGFADERHLWPHWHWLIEQRRPAIVLGEQVASASDWLRLVRGDLEALGYAVGAIPIEAASAGADHKRDRFWFVANDGSGRCSGSRAGESEQPGRTEVIGASDFNLVNTASDGRREGRSKHVIRSGRNAAPGNGCAIDLAHLNDPRSQGRTLPAERAAERSSRQNGMAHSDFLFQGDGELQRGGQQRGTGGTQEARNSSDMAHSNLDRTNTRRGDVSKMFEFSQTQCQSEFGSALSRGNSDGRASEQSSNYEWVLGADGKARRVKPGIRLLAYGIPNRVGKLRGFGNAIDPRPAAAFIKAALGL